MTRLKTAGKNLITLCFWLLVWQLLSLRIGKPLLLPSPVQVIGRLFQLAATAGFWRITVTSLLRIVCGMLSAVVLGTLLAVLTSRSRLLYTLFAPVLTLIKSTPVASFIILALIWLGRDALPAFIASLMVLPMVWANVSAGISQTDRGLLEVGKVFQFGKGKLLTKIYFPSVLPYFVSACKGALGLAWKAGIAAEVLTVPAVSIGKMLYESKLYLEVCDLFAWTLAVVICSLIIEKVLVAAVGALGRRRGGIRKNDRA